MESLGLAVYAACVDFLLRLSDWLHITYRDANAALFFLLWPIVTAILFVVVAGQGLQLAWLDRRAMRRAEMSSPKPPARAL